MNDKQLLELAAKAYGFVEIIFRDGADDDGYDNGIWTYTWVRDADGQLINWNPLDDDGDALRLRNRISAVICDEGCNVYVSICKFQIETIEIRQSYESDTESGHASQVSVDAATRRAIVRAAAELVKKLK